LTPHVIDTKKNPFNAILVAFKGLAKISMAFRELTPPVSDRIPLTIFAEILM